MEKADTARRPGSMGPRGHRSSVQVQIEDLEGGGGGDLAHAVPLVPHPLPADTLGMGPLARCELVASLQHLDAAIPRQVGGRG